MNFLAPAAFFLGLLLPVIVALYLLKLRRIERAVPSTFLWRRMVRDVEANAPWQRLQPNLLMILQLLFLAALILALTRPFTWTEGAGGDAAIIILDTSASMAAVDVVPSRIESAKQRARKLIDDLQDSARLTIIEAGAEARVLLSSSLDRRQAHLAVQSVHAGSGGSDMRVAIELASAIAARQPGTEIVVLSDGRVDLPDRLALRGRLRYIPFGLDGENQAVSLLTLETTVGGSLTAFAQVSNYGQAPAARRLSIFTDGLLFNVYDLAEIPPGGMRGIVIEGLPQETLQVEAQLDGSDTLALDDQAAAVRPDAEPVPVTLVTPGNLFIKTALSLLPGVILTEQTIDIPPAVAEDEEPSETVTATPLPTLAPAPAAGSASILIYDNYIPDVLPEGGSLLFIAPPRSSRYFTITGLVEQPLPRAVDAADPLLRHISFSDVSVLDAARIPLPDWATPVVSGDLENENVPLIFRGEVEGRRIAVLAFDLRHSDLPLQIAFPLLWANLIEWLAPGAGSAVPAQVQPGEVLVIPAPEGVRTAALSLPDRSTTRLQAESGQFIFNNTNQLGVYQVRFESPEANGAGREAAFAVNLFSLLESDLKPAGNLPGLSLQDAQTSTGAQQAMREWWRPLAMLALGLLVGEWLVYQRGALARLRDWLRGPLAARGKRGLKKGIG
jgi:Ca-activated chloride channel homolog